MTDAVRFEGVSKRFGATTAVDDLNLTVRQGEFFSLLGPSGCGKTTTLRMVAGFEQPTEGSIFLDDEPVAGVPRTGATSTRCSRAMRCSSTSTCRAMSRSGSSAARWRQRRSPSA